MTLAQSDLPTRVSREVPNFEHPPPPLTTTFTIVLILDNNDSIAPLALPDWGEHRPHNWPTSLSLDTGSGRTLSLVAASQQQLLAIPTTTPACFPAVPPHLGMVPGKHETVSLKNAQTKKQSLACM